MGDKINLLAMKDTVKNSRIALPVIAFFEIFMLILWISSKEPENSISYYGYPVEYVLLLLITIIVYVYILINSSDIERKYKNILIVQYLYALFFVIWAVSFTYIGAYYRNSFSEILYITVITLIPVFCYIRPVYYSIVQSITAVAMMHMASFGVENFNSFRTNFTIFTVISIIAGVSLYRLRKNNYIRQLCLEAAKETMHTMAFVDFLTKLQNRLSYEKTIAEIRENKNCGKFSIGMFDLNNLKQINDRMGHQAGDVLIMGAAVVLGKAFEGYGDIYRIGGDEFCGILRMSNAQWDEALKKLDVYQSEWSANRGMKLSIAKGFACSEENELSIDELEIMADNAMYEDKRKAHNEV